MMIMERKRITPEIGKEYEHKISGTFRCLSIDNEMSLSLNGVSGKSAVLQNTETGWTFLAHGVNMYENGTIDWEFSTQGRFERLPKEFKYNKGDWIVYTNSDGECKSGTIIQQIQTDDNKLMYCIEGEDRNIAEDNINYMTFKEFVDTPMFAEADVVTAVDCAGQKVDGDWIKDNSPVVSYKKSGGALELTIGKAPIEDIGKEKSDTKRETRKNDIER